MKRYNILLSFLLVVLASCTNDRFDFGGNNASVRDGLHIIGAVEDFDIKNVGTRADGEEIADSYISEMTMFVFKPNGDLIQGYRNRTVVIQDDDEVPTTVTFDDADKCTSAINIQKGNPTFLIDTKKGYFASLDGNDERMIYYDNGTGNTNATGLDQCSIYIVANAWHQLEGKLNDIKRLDDLKAVVLDIDNTLDMPKNANGQYRGFPMIGTHIAQVTFDLSQGGSNAHSVATIPLKKLFSKVRFTIQVNADQVVSGQIPKFQIEKAEVFNVPTKAKLGRDLDANGKPEYGDDSDSDYITELAGGSLSNDNVSTYYQYPFGNGVGAQAFEITNFKDGKTTVRHNESDDQTSDIIEFSFYVPEHKVTPNPITYPTNLPTNLKQYYKPKGVGVVRNGDGTTNASKIATFVRIHGVYTDHNGQIKDVRYDIYLGQNNYDDFTIKRNQLLNNKLIIMGLTNYHDAYGDVEGNISIDHRVDVDNKGFNLSMERTAILDSHFEVRPLDIELAPGSSMTVKIPQEYQNWIAMESDARARETKDGNTYVNTSSPRKGVRKYFTTDLVSELNNANKGEITVKHSGANAQATEIHRLWFYVDENVNVYDQLLGTDEITSSPNGNGAYTVDGEKMYRNGKVQFYHAASGDPDLTAGPNVSINFQQWNLWRVWNSSRTRYYDIECEEEYLNNYASDQIYGDTKDGMAYGLENVQLSSKYPSLVVKQNVSGWFAGIIEGLKEYFGGESMADLANTVFTDADTDINYDFYLSRDMTTIMEGVSGNTSDITNKLTQRDYSGLEMNKDIAQVLKDTYSSHQTGTNLDATIDKLILTEDPKSAFAYCYNKNKRNSDGSVNVDDIKWFLPAIDEIEEIAAGAYVEFDSVFQNKKYWSCQPSYELRAMNLSIIRNRLIGGQSNEGSLTGNYFIDDVNRARATSVVVTKVNGESQVNTIGSATPRKSGTQKGQAVFNWTGTDYIENQSKLTTFDIASPAISESDFNTTETLGNMLRTTENRIRAVYRSGTK